VEFPEVYQTISIVVPFFNEEANIDRFHAELCRTLRDVPQYNFELIYVNDGSRDSSYELLAELAGTDQRIKIIDFSRNFGKEIATTAGLHSTSGEAAIILDADLQHPVFLIPQFLERWESGAEVVIGVRNHNQGASIVSRVGSYLFYKIINAIAENKITPRATDYRLLDRSVINEFNRFTEHHRMTRGLIAWLGFRREFIEFDSPRRAGGKASYKLRKLLGLAVDSFVSLSLLPLKLAGYLGVFITILSTALGAFVIIEEYILNDPWRLSISGSAILAIIIMFLVGIILMCLGLVALYIAAIHGEVINRPLYVIRQTPRRGPRPR
jgi:dolichol-phosphate mannosyltransferase